MEDDSEQEAYVRGEPRLSELEDPCKGGKQYTSALMVVQVW